MIGNGLYTETYVKRKVTPAAMLAKGAMLVVGIVLMLGGMLFLGSGLLAFLGVAVLIAFYFVNPMFNIDWEYIFCDGQIDFDRISGGERRKNMLKIDIDNIDVMAPERSHELDSYNHQQGITVKDFTSKSGEGKVYCIFISKDGQRMKIMFEPSETMVDYCKQKGMRKVFTM